MGGFPHVVVQRAADRPVSRGDGVLLRHGLSFGAHYDPDRTSFGALAAHNVDELAPGVAYGAHEHRDVEILTWVLAGDLVHVDADGGEDVVPAGSLQYLATGTGWRHDERAAGSEVRLVQMWLAPAPGDPPPGPPRRRVLTPGPGSVLLARSSSESDSSSESASGSASGSASDLSSDLSSGSASDGEVGAPIALLRGGVTLSRLRWEPGERHRLDDARWRHVHVTAGALDAEDAEVAGEDPARLAGVGDTLEVTGRGPCAVVAGTEGAEALVVATL